MLFDAAAAMIFRRAAPEFADFRAASRRLIFFCFFAYAAFAIFAAADDCRFSPSIAERR